MSADRAQVNVSAALTRVRRGGDGARSDSSAGNHDGHEIRRLLISGEWPWVSGGIIVAVLLQALHTSSLPGLFEATLFTLSASLIASSYFFRKYEIAEKPSTFRSNCFVGVFIGWPMLLFGYAVGSWSSLPDGPMVPSMVAFFVGVTAFGMIQLQGRVPSMIDVPISAWLGYSIYAQDDIVPVLLLLCIYAPGVFALISFHHRRQGQYREAQAEIRKAQLRAEKLLHEYEETGQGWFWETDRHGNVTYVSKGIDKLLGGSGRSFVGRPIADLFILDSADQNGERTLNFHLSTRSSFKDLELRAATDEEEVRWWSVTGRPVMDSYNNFMGFRGFGSDLTESKRSQQHVTQLARFDSLTKLANRFQVSEWLEKILSVPQVERRACAVFLLDLDRFKQVNDTMGHPVGDALLKQVAERLRSTVGEVGSVGRLGGDEFQVLLPGRHEEKTLTDLADRIIETLSQPYSIEGQRVIIGASVGIAVCPAHGTTSEELIRNADLALYAAKDGGRGRYHIYAKDLHSEAEERHQLEQELRDAVASGQLELHYQPQVSTTTETISGFEALLRWKHPVHGYVSPEKFVPIAEDAGLIVQIGDWALRTACDAMAEWPESIRVAVNVSAIQFADPSLPSTVMSALANSGVEPGRLELEITESVFINEDKSTDAMFTSLKGIGVRLALDDFGTGYSSLGYLKKAPFDKIKIDQSFVRGATVEGSRNGALISSIVGIAESLGMETTAEGVETLDELQLIRNLGCSHIQGYIYEKPLTRVDAMNRIGTGLKAIAKGPKSARETRQTTLRKVLLEHSGHTYEGTIRNISRNGALVEGLWNVPPGTQFDIHLSKGFVIQAMARWADQDRMGVEFSQELEVDENNAVTLRPPRAIERPLLKKTG